MKKTATGLCSFPGCGVERYGNGATCRSHGAVLEQALRSGALQQSLQAQRLPMYTTGQVPLAMGVPVYNAVHAMTEGQHLTAVHTRPSLPNVQHLSQFMNHGPQLHQPRLPGEHSTSEGGLNISRHTPTILRPSLTADNARQSTATTYPPDRQVTETTVRNLAMFRLSPHHQGRGTSTAAHMHMASNPLASKSVKSWHSPHIPVTSAPRSTGVGKGPPSQYSVTEQQSQPRHCVDQLGQSMVQPGNGVSSQGVGEQVHNVGQPHQGLGQPVHSLGQLRQDVNQPGNSMGQTGHRVSQRSQAVGQAGQSVQPGHRLGQRYQGVGQPGQDVNQPRHVASEPGHSVHQPGHNASQPVQDLSQHQQIISQGISGNTHSHNIQTVGRQQINATFCHGSSPNDVARRHDTDHVLNTNSVMVPTGCQGSAALPQQHVSVQPHSDKSLLNRKHVDEEDVIIVEMDDDVLFTGTDPPSEKLSTHHCSHLSGKEHGPTSTFQASVTTAASNVEEVNSDEDCIVLDFSENVPPAVSVSSHSYSQDGVSEKHVDSRKTGTSSLRASEEMITPTSENISPTGCTNTQSQPSSDIMVLEAVSLSEQANYSILQASEAKAYSVLSAESYYRCGCSGGQCGFRTVMPTLLELHFQEAHPNEKAYPCVHCGNKEEGQERLLQHLEQHLSMQTLSLCCCEVGCNFNSFSAKEVIHHMEMYHKNLVKFTCWRCSSHFDNLQRFTDHVKQNLLTLFRCALCSAKDVDRQALLTHITSSHPDRGRVVGIQQVLLCKERNANGWSAFENSSALNISQPSQQEKPLARSVNSSVQHSNVQNAPINTMIDVVSPLTTNAVVSSVMQQGSEATRENIVCERDPTAHEELTNKSQSKLEKEELENRMSVSALGSENTDSLHDERMSVSTDMADALQSVEACVGTENPTQEHSGTGHEDTDESIDMDLDNSASHDAKLKETGVTDNWDTEETHSWLKKTCSSNVAGKYTDVVCKICSVVSKCLEDHVNHVCSLHREHFEGFACQHCSFVSVDPGDHSKHQCAPKRHLRSRSGIGCLNEDFLSLVSPLRSAVMNSTPAKLKRRSSVDKARKYADTAKADKTTVAKHRNALGSVRKGCRGRGKRLPGRVLCNLCGLSGTSFTHMQLHLYKEHSTVMACPYCSAKPVNDRLMYLHFMEHHPDCLNHFELVKSQNFISSITSARSAAETDHTIEQETNEANVNSLGESTLQTTLGVKQGPGGCKHSSETSEKDVKSQILLDDGDNGQSDTALKDAVKLETLLSIQKNNLDGSSLKDSVEMQTHLPCDISSEATSDATKDLMLGLSDSCGSTENEVSVKGLPYCKLCNFDSSWLSQLRNHVYKHHKEVMKCPRCEVHPANDRHFYRHLSNFHREEKVLLFNRHKSINWIEFPVGYKRGTTRQRGQPIKCAQKRDHSAESGTDKSEQLHKKTRLSVSPQTSGMRTRLSSSKTLASDVATEGTNYTSCRQPHLSSRNTKVSSSIGNATPAKKRTGRSSLDSGIFLSPGKKTRASQLGLFECMLCPFSIRCRGSGYRHVFAKHREVVQCSICNTSNIDSARQLKKHVHECHQEQKDLYKKLAPNNWLRFSPGKLPPTNSEKKNLLEKNISVTSKENPGSPQVGIVLHSGTDSVKSENAAYDPNSNAAPNPETATTSTSASAAAQVSGRDANVSQMSGGPAARESLNLKREAEAASSSFISEVLQLKNMMPASDEEGLEYRCPHCTSDFKLPHRFYEHLCYHYHYRCFKCGHCSHLAFAASAVFNHSKKAHPELEPDMQHLKKVTFENRIQRVMQNNHVHFTAPYTERRLLAYERARMKKDMKKKAKNTRSKLSPRKPTKVVDQNRPSLKVKLKLGKKTASIVNHKARKIVKKHIKVKKAGTPSEAVSGGEKWLQCPYCRAEKKTQKTIEREIRYHIHYKPFRCPYCDACSGSETFIPKHIEKAHPNKAVSVEYERIERKEHRFRLLFERSLAMAGSVIKEDVKRKATDHIHDGETEAATIIENANLTGEATVIESAEFMKSGMAGEATVLESADCVGSGMAGVATVSDSADTIESGVAGEVTVMEKVDLLPDIVAGKTTVMKDVDIMGGVVGEASVMDNADFMGYGVVEETTVMDNTDVGSGMAREATVIENADMASAVAREATVKETADILEDGVAGETTIMKDVDVMGGVVEEASVMDSADLGSGVALEATIMEGVDMANEVAREATVMKDVDVMGGVVGKATVMGNADFMGDGVVEKATVMDNADLVESRMAREATVTENADLLEDRVKEEATIMKDVDIMGGVVVMENADLMDDGGVGEATVMENADLGSGVAREAAVMENASVLADAVTGKATVTENSDLMADGVAGNATVMEYADMADGVAGKATVMENADMADGVAGNTTVMENADMADGVARKATVMENADMADGVAGKATVMENAALLDDEVAGETTIIKNADLMESKVAGETTILKNADQLGERRTRVPNEVAVNPNQALVTKLQCPSCAFSCAGWDLLLSHMVVSHQMKRERADSYIEDMQHALQPNAEPHSTENTDCVQSSAQGADDLQSGTVEESSSASDSTENLPSAVAAS